MFDAKRIEKVWIIKAGLKALVLAQEAGHRCGYVAIENTHPWFGLKYDNALIDPLIEVHGGLTYSRTDEVTNLHWFGYDCAHAGDAIDATLMPTNFNPLIRHFGVVRTLEYCVDECESLAEQLSKKK